MKSYLKHSIHTLRVSVLGAAAAVFGHATLSAEYYLIVTIENVAPYSGTFQTPFWFGLHDGSFDLFDDGAPASSLPREGSEALERLAEDGNTGPLMEEFANLVPDGVQQTIASNGPIPPLAPGQTVSRMIHFDPYLQNYISFASMVIPSNDAFIANEYPHAFPIFDEDDYFVAYPIFVPGIEVRDAGTEYNDELPANTAFFGQAAPNTGEDENDVVGDHPGFELDFGGILDDPMFRNADFFEFPYSMVQLSFDLYDPSQPLLLMANLGPTFETPPPTTDGNPQGEAYFFVRRGGQQILYFAFVDGLSGDARAAHLHLAPVGQTGPVVVPLNVFEGSFLFGRITADDVTGPLGSTDYPMQSLLAEMITGNVYVNVHTAANPPGEVRGQAYGFSPFFDQL